MGYKSAVRSLGAIARQAERKSIRRSNELLRQHKQYEKMAELEQAEFEVEEYENKLEQLLSIHQDVSPAVDWKILSTKAPPVRPVRRFAAEVQASDALAKFRPSLLDKFFNKVGLKTKKLIDAVEEGKRVDENLFMDEMKYYDHQLIEHNESVELANKILSGNIESYIEVIREINPFSELSGLGSSLDFNFKSSGSASIIVNVKSESAIPKYSKTLLKSGKLSIKDMPVGKFNEVYQDYVCSSVLRVAREIFALLPLNEIVVTAKAKILDTSTGKMADKCILSVLIPRETMDQMQFERIDPSDAMRNFRHNMGFKRSVGLSEVNEIA